MKFLLIDRVVEHTPDSLTAVKNISAAEEYLADHFPGFPILPGVFMLEAAVQACREHLRLHPIEGLDGARAVLGTARAVKYGAMVPPGSTLTIHVARTAPDQPDYKARAEVSFPGTPPSGNDPAPARLAVQGRLTLRAPIPAP